MENFLYYITLSSDVKKLPNGSLMPSLNEGDISLFHVISSEESQSNILKWHINDGEMESYSSKRRINSILASCKTIPELDPKVLSNSIKSFRIHSLTSDHGLEEQAAVLGSIIEKIMKDQDEWDVLEEYKNALKGSGEILARELDSDGKLGDFKAIKFDDGDDASDPDDDDEAKDDDEPVEATEDSEGSMTDTAVVINDAPLTMEETEPERIIKIIRFVCKQSCYEGFMPEIARNQFYNIFKNQSSVEFARSLTFVFVAYCNIKNNVGKLGTNRVDLEWSKKLFNVMDKLGIKKKADGKEALTLPRLSIAFMPELLAYRKYIAVNLQQQTESTVDVIYQDLAFNGCPSISGLSGYDVYHKEMSSYIYESGKETAIDDKKFLSALARWSKVSKMGYKRDLKMIERMNMVFTSSRWSSKTAFQFIKGAFDNKDYVDNP